MPATTVLAAGTVADRAPDIVGHQLLAALGLADATDGSRVRLAAGAPPAAGTVLEVSRRSVTLRAEEPHSGIVQFGVFDHAGAAVMVRGCLFGSGSDQAAARESARWSAWLPDSVAGLVALT